LHFLSGRLSNGAAVSIARSSVPRSSWWTSNSLSALIAMACSRARTRALSGVMTLLFYA
jgi:hypothetical protein